MGGSGRPGSSSSRAAVRPSASNASGLPATFSLEGSGVAPICADVRQFGAELTDDPHANSDQRRSEAASVGTIGVTVRIDPRLGRPAKSRWVMAFHVTGPAYL